MKTKGQRKSSNVSDARGRSVGSNDYPTYLSAARDRKNTDKFVSGGYSTASKSQMAKDAGIDGVGRKPLTAEGIRKSVFKKTVGTGSLGGKRKKK